MRKITTLLGVLLLIGNCILAQTRQISGKITDAGDNSPLTGVTVTAKGTKSAVITGPDGSFTIHVSPKATALHISYIGYEDKDIPLGSGTEPLVFNLTRAKSALSEVVVVGYGKASKKDITGSISRLDAKAVENYPAPSFESAIQGKAPGGSSHLR
jgi:TonB-dependent starch-binding outer membrane protein SusC